MNTQESFPSHRWAVLAAAAFACLMVQATGLALAPLLPQISVGLRVDLGAASNYVNTTFLLSGSLMGAILGGYFCDRFGVLAALVTGLSLATFPAALMPWIGHNVTGVVSARLVEGLSQGFVFPAIGPVMVRWFPSHQRGLAGGLMTSAIAVGSAAGMLVGPVVFSKVGDWRVMSAWLSLPGWAGMAFALGLVRLPGPTPFRAKDGQADSTYLHAAVSRFTLLGIGVTFLTTWALQCLYTLTSTFLAADAPIGAGYGAVRAGQLMLGVTLLGGVLGPILNGLLLDRVFHGNARPSLLLGCALMSVCVYALSIPAVTESVYVLEFVLVAAGVGTQFALPTIYYFVARSYTPQMAGKMTGLWTGLGAFGGALGVYVAGITVDRYGGYETTFAIQAAVALAAFILTFALTAPRSRCGGGT